jgi:hypothetical protein
MAGQIHKYAANEQDRTSDDRALAAVLAKYAAVEPPPGLEERILVKLRASPQPVNRVWSRWGLAAAAAVVIVAAVAWRSGRPSHPVTRNDPPATTQGLRQPETQVANRDAGTFRAPRGHVPIRKAAVHPQPNSAAHPKLDVFPSPQPLSEQEKILASYVATYPKDAALIGEARMEALRRDREEELQESAAAGDRDSQLR